ncbi:MAG: DUF3592 domain-containing protein [Chloroflexi bacterium]|nr:DUF3592 domain-containing protein [Chloroflexota bacterium]
MSSTAAKANKPMWGFTAFAALLIVLLIGAPIGIMLLLIRRWTRSWPSSLYPDIGPAFSSQEAAAGSLATIGLMGLIAGLWLNINLAFVGIDLAWLMLRSDWIETDADIVEMEVGEDGERIDLTLTYEFVLDDQTTNATVQWPDENIETLQSLQNQASLSLVVDPDQPEQHIIREEGDSLDDSSFLIGPARMDAEWDMSLALVFGLTVLLFALAYLPAALLIAALNRWRSLGYLVEAAGED